MLLNCSTEFGLASENIAFLHSNCSQLVLHISLVLIWSQVSRTVRSNEVEITKKYRKFDNTSFRGKRGQGLHELIPQLRTQKHILEADLISILLFKAVPKDNFTSRSVMNVIVRGTFGLVRWTSLRSDSPVACLFRKVIPPARDVENRKPKNEFSILLNQFSPRFLHGKTMWRWLFSHTFVEQLTDFRLVHWSSKSTHWLPRHLGSKNIKLIYLITG